MTYLEICKYVFSEERVLWDMRTFKGRRRQLVQAKQISVYLGNWFFPQLSNSELAEPFDQDRSTVNHSIQVIKGYLQYDKNIRTRIDKYLTIIRGENVIPENEDIFLENDFYINK